MAEEILAEVILLVALKILDEKEVVLVMTEKILIADASLVAEDNLVMEEMEKQRIDNKI